MKALVLSGGVGTQLRPITHISANQLVPVADKPALFHSPDSLIDVGITEVGVVVGDTADEIRKAVGDGSAFGLKVTVEVALGVGLVRVRSGGTTLF